MIYVTLSEEDYNNLIACKKAVDERKALQVFKSVLEGDGLKESYVLIDESDPSMDAAKYFQNAFVEREKKVTNLMNRIHSLKKFLTAIKHIDWFLLNPSCDFGDKKQNESI